MNNNVYMDGEFITNIKQWVNVDNEIKKNNDKLKQLRAQRKELGENIIDYANNNKLNQSIINISDGNLTFVQTKQPCYLTLTHVETCLGKFIENKDAVAHIMSVIKNTRSSTVIPDIKRTYNKDSK